MNIKQLGRYRIINLLGKGKFAAVYLAEDKENGDKVALKIFNRELDLDINMIINEARWLERFHYHPHIVKVYAAGIKDGYSYIAMEYMEGGTLRDRIGYENESAQKTLEIKEAITIIMQIASALDSMHKGNMVHRDIKPENILFRPDGLAKLSDFGFTRELKESETFPTICGSFDCIPPEVARGEGGRHNADVYSLGCVLYEILTGFTPYPRTYLDAGFDEEFQHEYYKKELENRPPKPRERNPDIPKDIEKIILRAMDPDRDRRYQTIREFMSDMDEVCYEMEVESTSETLDLERDRYIEVQKDRFETIENELMAEIERAIAEIEREIEKAEDDMDDKYFQHCWRCISYVCFFWNEYRG